MDFIKDKIMKKINVFYRICPYQSSRSVFPDGDKLTQTKICLASFWEAFRNVTRKITFILDSCPPEYKKEIDKIIDCKKTYYEGENMGNLGSYMKQIELALKLNDKEKVYFAEDDYLYVPKAGEKLQSALDVCDFVTLYDHPDYYHAPHLTDDHINIYYFGQQWISRMSTCLTFGTRAGYIKKKRKVLEKYGVSDFAMWCELTEEYDLFSPVPSLATHAVVGLLAPNIDWQI